MDGDGAAKSTDKGTSYRKLLGIAFDLATLRAYRDVSFPRFVYLDGALEQLDPRKRENLNEVVRESAAAWLQPIISLIDSDLPAPLGTSPRPLAPEEAVLTQMRGDLHKLLSNPVDRRVRFSERPAQIARRLGDTDESKRALRSYG